MITVRLNESTELVSVMAAFECGCRVVVLVILSVDVFVVVWDLGVCVLFCCKLLLLSLFC